jgi:hypothetical protein
MLYFERGGKRYFLAGRFENLQNIFVLTNGHGYEAWDAIEDKRYLADKPVDKGVRHFVSITDAIDFRKKHLDDSFMVQALAINMIDCPDCDGTTKMVNGDRCHCGKGKLPVFNYVESV